MKYKINKIEFAFKTWATQASLLRQMSESLRLMGAVHIQLDAFIIEANNGIFFATCEEKVAKEFSRDWAYFLLDI